MTLKFDVWPWKTIGHFFYATLSFEHHFVAMGDFKPEMQAGNAQFGSKSMIFRVVWPCNLTMTLKNNKAPLLCYFKHCASFRTHWWIQTGVTVWKRPIWVKFGDFYSRATLKFDGWPWKNNRAPLQCNLKLCASFRSHWWIQTVVTVQRQIWVKFEAFFSDATLKLDVWP